MYCFDSGAMRFVFMLFYFFFIIINITTATTTTIYYYYYWGLCAACAYGDFGWRCFRLLFFVFSIRITSLQRKGDLVNDGASFTCKDNIR